MPSDVCRAVRVGADGNDLAAPFFVAAQKFGAGVLFPQTLVKPAGIDLDAFAVFNEGVDDPVKKIGIAVIAVAVILFLAVADHIVDMPVNVKIGKTADRIEDLLKIGAVAFFRGNAFIIGRMARILMVYDMGGADDKVKIIALGIGGDLTGQIRLQPKLDAEADFDLTGKFLTAF